MNLEHDFEIALNHNDLPIEYSPCRIKDCMVCVCLSGHANIEIDLRPYYFVENDIFEVFPGQILACNDKSPDFQLAWLTFSNQIIDEVLYRLPADFIGFLKDSIKYKLPFSEREEIISEHFVPIFKIYGDLTNICRREMILNLVTNFYLHLYNKVVQNNRINAHQHERKRKKELLDEFFRLVKDNTGTREVAFFAGKLCITPKYLSIITKEITGSSAKELIDKFAITELKLRLKSSTTPLKEIAEQLNYPCEAFLCKYFKKHAGIPPSHYRHTSR